MIEEHKQVGHLISIFQTACFLTLLKHHGQSTVIPELLHKFPCTVGPMGCCIFFFFRIHCLGYPTMYISLMMQWCLKTLISLAGLLLFQSKIFDTIHIMIFLGTISNIWGRVQRSLLKSATACIFFVFLGVLSYSCPCSSRTLL